MSHHLLGCRIAISVLSVLCIISNAATAASELVPNIKVADNGTLSIKKISAQVVAWMPGYKARGSQSSSFMFDADGTQTQDGLFKLHGTLVTDPKMADAKLTLIQQMKKQSSASVSCHLELNHPTGIKLGKTAWTLSLPADRYAGQMIFCDQKQIALPYKVGLPTFMRSPVVRKIVIPTDDGQLVISSKNSFKMEIVDVRAYRGKVFEVRVLFEPSSGLIRKAQLQLNLAYDLLHTTSFDLRNQCNMGFADEVSGDGKGGWTDQGPANDLRNMLIGDAKFANVPFSVIDPKTSQGKSCMVITGPQNHRMSNQIMLQPSSGKSVSYIYLLHAAAWTPSGDKPVGSIQITYDDGTTQLIKIHNDQDVGNWWNPRTMSNATIAWSQQNASSQIGVYVSEFAVKPKPIRSINLAGQGKAMWMVLGMTGSNLSIPRSKIISAAPLTFIDKNQWQPIEMSLDADSGSALDFSFMTPDMPAGLYGPVVNRNGQFEFANRPGKQARFFGPNICAKSNFPTHADADILALRFKRMGYNLVRFHHYDKYLLDKNSGNSYTFDAQQLQRLDYLFAAMKRQGLYVTIDLYSSRSFPAGEIKEMNQRVYRQFKMLMLVSDSAMQTWQRFASNLMTHVNPYTGMTWASDPALVSICPVNEDTIFERVGQLEPTVRVLFEKKFEAFLASHVTVPVDTQQRAELWGKFLTKLQIKANDRMIRYLRKCNVHAPVTGVNYRSYIPQVFIREKLEMVDMHGYWDHPQFPGKPFKMPYRFHQRSALKTTISQPRGMFFSRVIGKPFSITEFNFVYPNPYRAEGSPITGAYAALQGWDMLCRFDYATTHTGLQAVKRLRSFSFASDPIHVLGDRIISLLYLRGDVQKAPTTFHYVVDEVSAYQTASNGKAKGLPASLSFLGLYGRVGSISSQALPASSMNPNAVYIASPEDAARINRPDVLAKDERLLKRLSQKGRLDLPSYNLKDGSFVSETGQIKLDGTNDAWSAVTDASETFVMLDQGKRIGQSVSVENSGKPCTVFVAALDDQPLASAERLLILHLTDVQNSEVTYENEEHQLVTKWGKLPLIARKATARVSIKCAKPKQKVVWALNMKGKRIRKMQTHVKDDTLVFVANPSSIQGSVFAYEMINVPVLH